MRIINKLYIAAFLSSLAVSYGATDTEIEKTPITLPVSVKSVRFDKETCLFSGDVISMAERIGGEMGAFKCGKKQYYTQLLEQNKEQLESMKKTPVLSEEIKDQITIQEALMMHYQLKLESATKDLDFFSSAFP